MARLFSRITLKDRWAGPGVMFPETRSPLKKKLKRKCRSMFHSLDTGGDKANHPCHQQPQFLATQPGRMEDKGLHSDHLSARSRKPFPPGPSQGLNYPTKRMRFPIPPVTQSTTQKHHSYGQKPRIHSEGETCRATQTEKRSVRADINTVQIGECAGDTAP